MQFERGKPPEAPNASYRAARIKDERWLSAGPGFETGRAGPRLSVTYSQDVEMTACATLFSINNIAKPS
jgi:hypothetical protein